MRCPIALLILTLFSLSAAADTLEGRVVGLADGDTVTVLDEQKTQHKIRLAGIDAPEKGQAYGNVSKQSLSDLVYDKTVSVDWHKVDRYGRKVGKILIDGLDANLEQVKRGLSWHYKEYAKEQSSEDQARYADAETQARLDKRGLWNEPEPIPPWAWRKMKRETQH
ncbi:MAG: thermonuclease family protein [Hydrogenophilales bacterium]|nr:thermonuclease family protein [Hydrogenophilales bacterium]